MKIAESTVAFTTDNDRWTAVVDRDTNADGQFYYSVRTTGVYCRPSCGARLPRRENVSFYATREAAEQAGFRPCKRCKPDAQPLSEHYADIVANACRIIETAETTPSLDALAQESGISRFHFHRIFKGVTGMTPKAYAVAHRTKRVREELLKSDTVTSAIYDAGFNSNGRFYARSSDTLGMTPTEFRAGGTNSTIRFAVGECTLGSILVAATSKGICAISLGDDPDALLRDLQDRFPNADLIGGDKNFEQTIATVIGYIETPSGSLGLPLDIRGTAFQQRVWQALQQIPVGKTASYAEIANRIGAPSATRAVAQACKANTIAVGIPCHRVVRSDGTISGYRWGVERKRELLRREKQA